LDLELPLRSGARAMPKKQKRDADFLNPNAPFGPVNPPVPNVDAYRKGWRRPELPPIDAANGATAHEPPPPLLYSA